MKARTLLKSEDKWVKWHYTDNTGRICLMEALSRCYKTEKTLDTAITKVENAIKVYTERKTKPNIVVFNDRKKTTFKDIQAVLKLANV